MMCLLKTMSVWNNKKTMLLQNFWLISIKRKWIKTNSSGAVNVRKPIINFWLLLKPLEIVHSNFFFSCLFLASLDSYIHRVPYTHHLVFITSTLCISTCCCNPTGVCAQISVRILIFIKHSVTCGIVLHVLSSLSPSSAAAGAAWEIKAVGQKYHRSCSVGSAASLMKTLDFSSGFQPHQLINERW